MPSEISGKTERALEAFKKMLHATESVVRLLDDQLCSFDLTTGQFRALEALLRRGPMSQVELGDAIYAGSSSTSLVIKILERCGLVTRRVDASNRNKKVAQITAEGKKLAMKVVPMQARLIRAGMAVLTKREQVSLTRLCDKLDTGNPLKLIRELTRMDEDEEEA